MSDQHGTNLKVIIANNIKYLMYVHNLSRKQISEATDISYTTLTDWIKARTYPRMEAIEKLSYYFHIHPKEFFLDIEKTPDIRDRVIAYAERHNIRMDSKDDLLHTADEYFKTPEGYPVELIRGRFVPCANSPSLRHQSIVSDLSFVLQSYIHQKKGKCKLFTGPVDVKFNTKEDTVLVPDIIIICDPKKITPHYCDGAPDLVIEVLSPSTKKKDEKDKLSIYEECGVKEYWMVDYETNTVRVLCRSHSNKAFDSDKTYAFSDAIPVGIYNDFKICLEDFYAD